MQIKGNLLLYRAENITMLYVMYGSFLDFVILKRLCKPFNLIITTKYDSYPVLKELLSYDLIGRSACATCIINTLLYSSHMNMRYTSESLS